MGGRRSLPGAAVECLQAGQPLRRVSVHVVSSCGTRPERADGGGQAAARRWSARSRWQVLPARADANGGWKARIASGPVAGSSTNRSPRVFPEPRRGIRRRDRRDSTTGRRRSRRSPGARNECLGRGAVVAVRDIFDRLRLGEVQASRARIAKAADDARRTIERDLHDGAQQQFVAVAMRLESARRLIGAAPADAARLVDAAQADLREAIAELRRLAHGIHSAELPKRGLRAASATCSRTRFPTSANSPARSPGSARAAPSSTPNSSPNSSAAPDRPTPLDVLTPREREVVGLNQTPESHRRSG